MTARKYDSAGRFVELDSRHSIRPEYTGAPPRGAAWVFRFCGDFVSSHKTKREAQESALQWEMDRVARMVRAAGIAP